MKHRGLIITGIIGLFILCLGGGFYIHAQRQSRQATQVTSGTTKTATKTDTKPTATASSAKWHRVKGKLSLPILMYHSLSHGNSLRLPPNQFAQQMKWLHDHHVATLTPAQVLKAFKTNSLPAKHAVFITLDDGYKDNLTAGLPILKKYHIHATVNIITGFVHHKTHLSLADMQQMKTTGLVSFASHTVTHHELNQLSNAQQWTELSKSKTWLDKHLHQQTKLIIYPVGRANRETATLAKKAGYQIGLTTQPGWSALSQGRYNLHRVRIDPDLPINTYANMVLNQQ